MNVDTGEIKQFENDDELMKAMAKADGKLLEIVTSDMTEKQHKNMRVSLHDNRSKLGKIRVKERKKRKKRKKRK